MEQIPPLQEPWRGKVILKYNETTKLYAFSGMMEWNGSITTIPENVERLRFRSSAILNSLYFIEIQPKHKSVLVLGADPTSAQYQNSFFATLSDLRNVFMYMTVKQFCLVFGITRDQIKHYLCPKHVDRQGKNVPILEIGPSGYMDMECIPLMILRAMQEAHVRDKRSANNLKGDIQSYLTLVHSNLEDLMERFRAESPIQKSVVDDYRRNRARLPVVSTRAKREYLVIQKHKVAKENVHHIGYVALVHPEVLRVKKEDLPSMLSVAGIQGIGLLDLDKPGTYKRVLSTSFITPLYPRRSDAVRADPIVFV
jgi:hypothetical protein